MHSTHINIGDIIVTQKGIWSAHYMVYVGIQNGIPTIAENQAGIGVRFMSLEEAIANKAIVKIEKFTGTEQERLMVITRAFQSLGKSYDLVSFNCEHFARLITSNKTQSTQVDFVSFVALLAGIGLSIGSLADRKNKHLIAPAAACFLVAFGIKSAQPRY